MNLSADLALLLPELILAFAAMALLLIGALAGDRVRPLISAGALVAFVAAGAAVVMGGQGHAFEDAFIADGFSRFAQVLILMGAMFCVLLSDEFFGARSRFELPILIVLGTLGMMMMVSAASFLSLYMGLELQSLALYVLATFNRDHLRSTEAGLKYFVLGALSSGMLLYGISLIYGFTGGLTFADVAQVVGQQGVSLGLIFGLVFLVAGLAFKISAVPFHMWTPDVYEGAPTPITAYFATAAKVAAFCLLLRVLFTPFAAASEQWRQIVIVVSVLSMLLGGVGALGQQNIKRLMAYSSIGHMGYALLGVAAGSALGARGVLIYMAIYVITNLGVFASIQAMRRSGKELETISDLSGLGRTNPKLALVFTLLFLSLAGLPPLAGFLAKFYVFLAAIEAHLIWPAVLGMLASAVGLVYYLRLVKIIYFDEPKPAFDGNLPVGSRVIMTVAGAFALLFIFTASPIISAADAAAKVLFP